jgi:hypothetical protein
MRKLACLLILAVVPSLATTRLRDVLYDGNGNRANGILFLEWPNFTTATGRAVAGNRKAISIKNGIVDVMLEATDGASPGGTLYTARFFLSGSSGMNSEQWAVPDTTDTVTLAQVRLNQGGGGTPGGGTGGTGGASTSGYSTTFNVTAYNAGTVGVTSGGTTVTGSGTSWSSSMVGSYFVTRGTAYLISAVPSAAELTLAATYSHDTEDSGVPYYIAQPVIVAGSTHKLGGANLSIHFYRDDTTRLVEETPNVSWVDSSSFDVKALFPVSVTGRVVIVR